MVFEINWIIYDEPHCISQTNGVKIRGTELSNESHADREHGEVKNGRKDLKTYTCITLHYTSCIRYHILHFIYTRYHTLHIAIHNIIHICYHRVHFSNTCLVILWRQTQSSASPRQPGDDTYSASVCPSSKPTRGPSCPYVSN